MSDTSSVFAAAKDWLWPVLIVFVAMFCLVAWAYTRLGASRKLRVMCVVLKLLGVAALLACLLEPTWIRHRAKPGANIVAIVADNSASMKLRGRDSAETRGDVLQRFLSGESNRWRTQLAVNFELRNYLADSRLLPTADFSELTFDGRASALGAALKTLVERHRGQPLAAILLLSDGVAPDLDSLDVTAFPPIYPVVLGSDQAPRDVGVTGTATTQASFEDAPLTIHANVSATGCEGEEIVAKLFAIDASSAAAEEKLVATEKLTVQREGEKLVFRFQLRPDKTGVLFYRLRVLPAHESSSEATLANNETVITVDRETGPHRVLYVSGRPNWEYKFLHRAVEGDSELRLVGLIRVARREAKFEFRGRAGESSNPLFRGFGNQSKEEIERYDQPVLIRTGTDDEFELGDGFPKTAEELFRYRAVILDDLEADFFTAEQMSLLQRFVSERGGGFLMLGGAESFAEGKFGRTAIGEMLPVYIDKAGEPAGEMEFQLALTREGWLQPWTRLRTSEPEEKKRLGELPHFAVLNRVREIKPAAMMVATASDGRTDYPALVTQRFGRGRTAALLIGDLWHGGLGDEARQKDLGKQWRQIVRWLVADVPERVELRAQPAPGGDSVRLEVRLRDAKFQPLDNAALTLKVQALGVPLPITMTAEASSSEPGLYEANYIPRQSGGYRVTAEAADESGAALGKAQTGWATDLAAAEFQSLTPNRALMESLARKTGGEVLSPDQLEAFAHGLPSKRVPQTETWTQPLWHTPTMFLFALGCFVAEWGLRRWNGLA